MVLTALALSACASSAAGDRSDWTGGSVMSFVAAEQLCRNEARIVVEASRPTVFEACMARNGWRRGTSAK
jgi:hypothetical protein